MNSVRCIAQGPQVYRSPASPPRRRGFTRADLLAVVAGLALVGALGRGALANGRSAGETALCLSNLRVLTRAWTMYATDNGGYLPPAPDDGNTQPGFNWCPGQAGTGGAQEFNPDILADPSRALLFAYGAEDVTLYRCPSDPRRGKYQGTDPALQGKIVPAARGLSMNHAVGANPYQHGGKVAVDGPWLDNMHNHRRGKTWRTYAKLGDLHDPAPSRLAVLLDEDEFSLNDSVFAFGMEREEWIDWPSARHDSAGTLSYADGSAELHRWIDPRTFVINGQVSRRMVPGSPDYAWLRERISAPLRPAE